MTTFHATHASLADAIAANMVLAGPDFQWDDEDVKYSRPRSAGGAFAGLRQWLLEQQGGRCPVCTGALVGEKEVGHVVAARDLAKVLRARYDESVDVSGHRGFTAGNMYLTHRDCNILHALDFGAVVPVEGFRMPELIPLTYPTRKEMIACGRRFEVAADARRVALRETRMGLGQIEELTHEQMVEMGLA